MELNEDVVAALRVIMEKKEDLIMLADVLTLIR